MPQVSRVMPPSGRVCLQINARIRQQTRCHHKIAIAALKYSRQYVRLYGRVHWVPASLMPVRAQLRRLLPSMAAWCRECLHRAGRRPGFWSAVSSLVRRQRGHYGDESVKWRPEINYALSVLPVSVLHRPDRPLRRCRHRESTTNNCR